MYFEAVRLERTALRERLLTQVTLVWADTCIQTTYIISYIKFHVSLQI